MPLGDLGNLHVGIEVDLSGLSAGLAKAQAEMKAAAEGMSSSSTTELGKVRTSYTQVGDEAERTGTRVRNNTRQTSDEVSRSSTSVVNDLGRVAAAHADMGRVSQISSEQVQGGIRAWAQSMELGRQAANLTSTDVQRGLREWSTAQNEHSNVVQRALASIGGAFGNTRTTIDTHISGIRASLLNLGEESVTPFRNAINSIGDTDAFRRLHAGVDDVAGAIGRFGLSGVNDIRNVGSETDRSTERSHTMRSAFEIGALAITTSMLFARQRMEEFGVATEALRGIFSPVAEAGRAGFERIGSSASSVASGLGRGFESALAGISGAFENHFARSSNSVNYNGHLITNAVGLTARASIGGLEDIGRAGERLGADVTRGAGQAAKGVTEGGNLITQSAGGILQVFGSLVSAIPALGGVGRIFTTMGANVAEGGTSASIAIIGIVYALIQLAGIMSFFVTQAVGAIFIIGVFTGALIGAGIAFSLFFGGLALVAGGIVALAASYGGWFNAGQNVQQAQSKLTTATNEHNTAVQELKKQQDSWNSSSSHSQVQLDSLKAAQDKVATTTDALSKAQNEYNDAVGKADNPLKHLTDSLTAMKDALGKAAVPLAGPILDTLTSMVPQVQKIGEGIIGWFAGIEPDFLKGMKQGFQDVFDIINALGPPFRDFFERMDAISKTPAFKQLEAAGKQFLVSTVAGLLDNLAKIADWFVKASTSDWGKHFGEIFSAIGQFVQGFGAHLIEIGDWFVAHWPQIIKWTSDLSAIFEKFLPVIGNIIGPIVALIGWLLKIPEIREGIKDIAFIFGVLLVGGLIVVIGTVALAAEIFFALATTIGFVKEFIETRFIPFVKSAFGAVKEFVLGALQNVTDFFTGLSSRAGTAVKTVLDHFGQFFAWISSLASAVGSAVQGILDWFGNLFSGIGSIVNAIITWVSNAWNWLWGQAGNIFGGIVNGIIFWFNTAWNFIQFIWGFISGWIQGIWNGIWSAVGTFFGGIVNGIIFWFNTAWNFIQFVWSFISGWIQGIWNGIWNAVGTFFGGIVNGIVFWFNTAWNFIQFIWSFISGWIQGIWNGIWSAVGTFFGGIVNGIIFWFNTAWNFIQFIWSFIWGWLQGTWNGILGTIVQWLTNVWNQIVFYFTTAWNFLSNLWSFIWGWLQGTWNGILATAVQWLTNVWNQIVFYFTTAWNWLSNLWSFIWGWLTGTWNSILATAIQWLTNVWNQIVYWFTVAWNFLSDLWSFIWGWLTGTWNGIWGTAGDLFNKIFKTIEYWAIQAYTTVQSWFNAMSDAVHNALSFLGKVAKDDLNWIIANVINKFLDTIWWAFHNIPGGGIDLPIHDIEPFAQGGVVGYAQGGIPGFAAGAIPGTNAGIVNHAKLFVAGEAGPETIIPWSPKYRDRAIGLLNLTAEKIGVSPPATLPPANRYGHHQTKFAEGGVTGIPHYAIGGIATSGHGGQCLEWLSNTIGFGRGIPAAKDAASLCNTNAPAEGRVFIDTGGQFGHAGFVYDTDQALDSNWGGDGMIRIHPLSDVQNYGPICYVDLGSPYGGASPQGGGGFSFSIQGAVDAAIQAALAGIDGIPHGLFKPVPAGLLKIIGPLFVSWATRNFAGRIAELAKKFLGATSGFVGGLVNAADITRLALQAGWSPGDIPGVLCHIAGESGGNPNAIGPSWNGDGGSIGLLQIQPGAHPQFDRNLLRDPLYNLEAGLQIFREAGGWGPWSVKCASGGVMGLCEGGVMGLGCGCLSGLGAGEPIPFDTGYNTIPPGLHVISNNTGVNETLQKVGPGSGAGAGGEESRGGVHNHFHGDVRVSPELFQEAFRRADWYDRTGQY